MNEEYLFTTSDLSGVIFCGKGIYETLQRLPCTESFSAYLWNSKTVRFVKDPYLPLNSICTLDKQLARVLKLIEEETLGGRYNVM